MCIRDSDYPALPFIEPGKPTVLQTTDFLYGIRQVKICCANDQLRPVMNGVYFDRDLDSITYVSTDGATLAVIEYPAAHVSAVSYTHLRLPLHKWKQMPARMYR